MSDNNDEIEVWEAQPQHHLDSDCAQEASLYSTRESCNPTVLDGSPTSAPPGGESNSTRSRSHEKESVGLNFEASKSSSQRKSSPQSNRRNLNSYLMQNQAASSFQTTTPTSTRKRKRPGIQAFMPQLSLFNDATMTPIKTATTTVTPTKYSKTNSQTTLAFQQQQKSQRRQQQKPVSPMTSLINQLVLPNGMTKARSPITSSRNGKMSATTRTTNDASSYHVVDISAEDEDNIASSFSDSDSDIQSAAVSKPSLSSTTFSSSSSQTPSTTTWQYYDSNRVGRRTSTATTTSDGKHTGTMRAPVNTMENATFPNRTNMRQNDSNPVSGASVAAASTHDAASVTTQVKSEHPTTTQANSTDPPNRVNDPSSPGNHQPLTATTTKTNAVETDEPAPSSQNAANTKLNAKQAQAVQAIKNKKNVFVTGPAGTGKSVVLKEVLKYCSGTYIPCQWVAVAPTGVTAVAIEGQTIHSFAGIGIPNEQEDFRKAWQKEKRQAWRGLKIMVIEEISMIAGEFLDRLDSVVRQIRGVDEPFGGIQVLICGDFLQLPPIAESSQKMKEMRESAQDPGTIHGNRGFAFQSYFWKEANLETIHLTEVYRQNNPQFASVLSRVRRGIVGEQANAFLAQCARPLTLPSKDIEPTRLYSKNVDVNLENMSNLDRLDGDAREYASIDHVIPDPNAKSGAEKKLWRSDFFRQTVAEEILGLKIGAQVMLIKNDTLNPRTLVNGSRGVVVGFTKEEPEPPFNIPISIAKSNSDEGRKEDIYPKVKFQNGETRVLGMAEFSSRILRVGRCIRVAVPLKLAWAITVHKSQGMTLDYVKIDLAGVFCKAQAYVALSRAKDEKCLELQNFSPRLVKADARALAFYDRPNDEAPNWDHHEKWTREKVKTEGAKKLNEPLEEEAKTESKQQSWV